MHEVNWKFFDRHRFTKQGSLKDKTDCSPSNGYYFLPVYDRGEYTLQISPPPGWSFEPEQIDIVFDGKTDLCSLGKDVNFSFKVSELYTVCVIANLCNHFYIARDLA